MLKRLGFTIASYCLVMRFLYLAVFCSASILISSIRSRLRRSCSLLSLSQYLTTLWLAICTSAGITASFPQASLKGALIPLCETMNPRDFPDETPKVHLLGFNFMLYCLSVSKVSYRSSRCFPSSRLFTSMSSTQTSMFRPIYGRNIWLINL